LTIGDLTQEAFTDIGNMAADMAALGWRAFAGIPLLSLGQSLGVIGLFSRQPGAASAYGLALLTTIGHQVATAIQNAQLFQATLNERCRLQALIRSSRDGVLLVGVQGRILVINMPALQLLHLPGQPEEWLGRSVRHVLRLLRRYAPAVAEAALVEMRRIQKGDEPPSEAEHTVPPHVVHWVNLPVLAGAIPLGRLLVLQDVTDKRAITQMRDDMTHMMVHDLRNPLAVVFGALKSLSADATRILPEDQREALELARAGTQKMVEVVDSILNISQLEGMRITRKRVPFRLSDLIAETVRSQASLAAAKGLRVESDVSPALPLAWADVELIARVLQNLVDNAVKFTPAGGQITVKARLEEVEGRSVLLVAVSDSGPGIPAEIQGQLFQKFVTGRQAGHGSGLGLAFCKLAVEAHAGRIWVESTSEHGTTIAFSLPATEGPRSA
jgi:signal transduction histidine kinase